MTSWGLFAVFLAGGSVSVWSSGRSAVTRRPDLVGTRLPHLGGLPRLVGILLAGLLLVVLGAAAMLGGGVRLLGAAALAAVALAALRRLVGGWRERKQRRRTQLDVIELCDSLAAELRAGLPAARALEKACAPWPRWATVVAAAAIGGDVPATFRSCATEPGAESLRVLAASWEVAAHSGAALAAVLDRMAAGLRSDDEARCEVTAALAPPRATAKMLAVLPVFGILLGTSMGARPVDFLLHSAAGWVCLGLGTALTIAGLLWVERLASSAEVA